MSRLTLLLLVLIHALYTFKQILSSLLPRSKPKPLLARRRRIPNHLAVILVPDAENHDAREEEAAMEECVEQMVDWCKDAGVQRLSVYDPEGVLSRNSRYASSGITNNPLELSEDISLENSRCPLTPPPSDSDSTSRSRSPDFEPSSDVSSVITIHIPYLSRSEISESHKKPYKRRRRSSLFEPKSIRKTITLHILSRESSKPAIAAAAQSFAVKNASQKARGPFHLPTGTLNDILEGEKGFPSPDLIIVHHLHATSAPLELHGFPPWQSRLSEMYYAPRRARVIRRQDPISLTLSEVEFRRALDEYSGAEMRLGK